MGMDLGRRPLDRISNMVLVRVRQYRHDNLCCSTRDSCYRKTLYVINESSVTYQRGSLGPTQTVELPAEQFQRITDTPGMFGKFLGYTTVAVRLKGESNYMRFSHIPAGANMTQKLIQLRDRYSDYDEAKEMEELAIIAARQRGDYKEDLILLLAHMTIRTL